jgi:hypothetical protein
MKTAIRLRIAFDALTDLSAAGLPREEGEDFERAWEGALGGLVEALGLDVCAVRHRGEATETPLDDDEDAETVLWQAAHDLCERDGSAPLGDRWQWSEPSASRVASLRQALRLPLAAEEAA